MNKNIKYSQNFLTSEKVLNQITEKAEPFELERRARAGMRYVWQHFTRQKN